MSFYSYTITGYIRSNYKRLIINVIFSSPVSPKMVRVWYMDNCEGDQRLKHMTDPPQFIDLKRLKAISGVEHYKINADNHTNDELLKKIKADRGYSYEDCVDIKQDTFPDYENKLKVFFEEHIHTDEEIRLIIDGSGYFDVRDKEDRWLRVELEKGDMIILPAGIYHRFTLDEKNYIKAVRYFVGEPVWTPHRRPAEEFDARKQYKAKMGIVV